MLAGDSSLHVFMSKITFIILIFISILIFFHKKIISYYYISKFSNWVERPVKIKKLNFNYSGYVKIEDIEILNNDQNYFKNIFKAEKIEINFDISSIFSDLILIKSLDIYDPQFFLDIIIKRAITIIKKFTKIILALQKKLMKIHQIKFGQKKTKMLIF